MEAKYKHSREEEILALTDRIFWFIETCDVPEEYPNCGCRENIAREITEFLDLAGGIF